MDVFEGLLTPRALTVLGFVVAVVGFSPIGDWIDRGIKGAFNVVLATLFGLYFVAGVTFDVWNTVDHWSGNVSYADATVREIVVGSLLFGIALAGLGVYLAIHGLARTRQGLLGFVGLLIATLSLWVEFGRVIWPASAV